MTDKRESIQRKAKINRIRGEQKAAAAAVERALAEAAVPRLRCIGGDPSCPCADGLACHYVDLPGSPAWPIPEAPP